MKSNTEGTIPRRDRAPRRGGPKAPITFAVVAAFAVLALSMSAVPAFAIGEGTTRYAPLKLDVTVTDVVREQGVFADQLTFTVTVTNTADTTTLSITEIDLFYDDNGIVTDSCTKSFSIRTDETKRMKLCFVVDSTAVPKALSFAKIPEYDYGFGITILQHILPFTTQQCGDDFTANNSCQAIQRIHSLIENVEPEPVMCVPPPNPPPTAGSTIYHKYMDHIILTFDMPVTLVDNWHEHISIYAEAESGTVEIDGLNPIGRNLIPDGGTLVWLSLAHDDAKQLDGVTNMTLHIKPGTIMYGDGQLLVSVLLPQVMVVP